MITFDRTDKLLVIAPHPDDEVIGCGGLIQIIKKAGGKVFILFLTVGDTKDFSRKGLSTSIERKKEIEKVAEFLNYDDYEIAFDGSSYHLQLDKLGQKKLMDFIERDGRLSFEKIKPTIVVFPSPWSYNQDHRVAGQAVHASLRPADKKLKHFVPIVLYNEEPSDVWNKTKHEEPNFFIPLSHYEIESKISALSLYKSQFRPAPNLRSATALKSIATLRGAEIGEEYAEGFICYRLAIKK